MIKKTIGFAARFGRPLRGYAFLAVALGLSAVASGVDDAVDFGFFNTATPPNTYANADGNPSRVFVTDSFIFVLETYSHRVAVYDRETHDLARYFGASNPNNRETDSAGQSYQDASQWAPGTGDGGFKKPAGMALDTFSGQSRLAVADTENNRVQLFSFDAATGEIEFVSAFGVKSPAAGINADEGTFKNPRAVAFAESGDIFVADTDNRRVVRLACDASGAMSWGEAFQFTTADYIAGLCCGKDDGDGFWIANSGNGRQCVSFYHTASFSADSPVVSFGTPAGRELSSPRDVQVWNANGAERIAVVDNGGSRIRVLVPRTGASGAYTKLVWAADVGSASDTTLQKDQKLFRPCGVFPVADTNLIYVADTGKNRVAWYGAEISDPPEEDEEEYETVPWLISSIDISADGATTTLGWAVPTENLPSDGRDLAFVIGYRPSLTTGAWNWSAVPSNTNLVEQAAVSGSADIDISAAPFSDNPDSAFFTLEWTNKVKE